MKGKAEAEVVWDQLAAEVLAERVQAVVLVAEQAEAVILVDQEEEYFPEDHQEDFQEGPRRHASGYADPRLKPSHCHRHERQYDRYLWRLLKHLCCLSIPGPSESTEWLLNAT